MVKIKKYKNGVERFLSGDKGQRFFNFAYSIGAAIVIWGALFKILHLPGGNLLLAIGMGTEVLMFILTAFDRPPKQYNWEEVFPELNHEERERMQQNGEETHRFAGSGVASGSIYINTSASGVENATGVMPDDEEPNATTSTPRHSGAMPVFIGAGGGGVGNSASMTGLSQMSEKSDTYVSELDMVIKELSKLRETTAAINTLYELQLKSISAQLNAIEHSGHDISNMRDMMERSAQQSERYCDETRKMAENMATLNRIYAGMISAMSRNENSTLSTNP